MPSSIIKLAKKLNADPMPNQEVPRDHRLYSDAERTFLAWIRTGLALMGFGFIVARFGLFLEEVASAAGGGSPLVPSTFSLPLGMALVLIGVIVNILSSFRHVSLVRKLNRGEQPAGKASKLGILIALLLAAVGIAMVFGIGRGFLAGPSTSTPHGRLQRQSPPSAKRTGRGGVLQADRRHTAAAFRCARVIEAFGANGRIAQERH